jgi:hypothetical protein
MHHDTILDVGACTDHDGIIVAAQDRPEPDADIVSEANVADDLGIGRKPETVGGRCSGNFVPEAIERHQRRLSVNAAAE